VFTLIQHVAFPCSSVLLSCFRVKLRSDTHWMTSLRACMPVCYDSHTDMKSYVVACWLVSRAYAIVARLAFHCTQTISLNSIFFINKTFCEMSPEMDNPSMLNHCWVAASLFQSKLLRKLSYLSASQLTGT
jgi:hypothetical protein